MDTVDFREQPYGLAFESVFKIKDVEQLSSIFWDILLEERMCDSIRFPWYFGKGLHTVEWKPGQIKVWNGTDGLINTIIHDRPAFELAFTQQSCSEELAPVMLCDGQTVNAMKQLYLPLMNMTASYLCYAFALQDEQAVPLIMRFFGPQGLMKIYNQCAMVTSSLPVDLPVAPGTVERRDDCWHLELLYRKRKISRDLPIECFEDKEHADYVLQELRVMAVGRFSANVHAREIFKSFATKSDYIKLLEQVIEMLTNSIN